MRGFPTGKIHSRAIYTQNANLKLPSDAHYRESHSSVNNDWIIRVNGKDLQKQEQQEKYGVKVKI